MRNHNALIEENNDMVQWRQSSLLSDTEILQLRVLIKLSKFKNVLKIKIQIE